MSDIQQAWDVQKDSSKKGSFFANIDKENKDFNMESIPTWKDSGAQADKKISSNESCWTCFKLYKLTVDTSEF